MSESRLRGRPRDRAVDSKILDATLDILANEGYEAVTIEAVAARAGVSRPSIYRRFENKAKLVIHATDYVFTELQPPVRASDDARDEILALLENTVDLLTKTPAGAVFRNLIPYFETEDAFGRHANTIGADRRLRLRKSVDQAIEEKLMAKPDNVDLWLDCVLGAIYFRFLITGRSLDKNYIHALVEH